MQLAEMAAGAACLVLLFASACSGDDSASSDALPAVDASADDGHAGDGAGADAQAAELCNGEDDDGDGLVDEGLEDFCGGCGRPFDLDVIAPYPIHATWMFGRSSACDWQNALEAFHRQGGEAVWQFGPEFQLRTAAGIRADPEFAACMQGSDHCVDRALEDLLALDAGNTVVNWLTYHFNDEFSDQIMSCPAADRRVEVGDRTYWRIVLPHSSGQPTCAFDGRELDVLFVYFEGVDRQELLLSQADGMQMSVYLGMPSAPHLAAQPWNVDTSLRPAYLDWTRRALEDYEQRHGGHASFAGVYQSFEVSLQASGADAIYATYGLIADVIRAALPGRAYVLSPYWDVNTDQGDNTIASVKEGFKRLARTGADIIAPQDGRGTGKSALYWPFQESEPIASVDPKLAAYANVNGNQTFAQQFNASTRELFAAVRDAVTELENEESVSVTLWANIEAFEFTTTAPCGYSWATDRTDKQRVDRALTMAGAYPTRTISFMWDAFYTCLDGGYSQSLHQEILDDFVRPVTAQAFFYDNGIIVRGFHLAAPGTTFNLTWYDSSWSIHSASVTPGWVTSGWGATHDRSPLLDEVWIPFDDSDLAPSFYVHIRPVAPGDLAAHYQYSLEY